VGAAVEADGDTVAGDTVGAAGEADGDTVAGDTVGAAGEADGDTVAGDTVGAAGEAHGDTVVQLHMHEAPSEHFAVLSALVLNNPYSFVSPNGETMRQPGG